MQIDTRNITEKGISLTFSKDYVFFPVLEELNEKGEYLFQNPVQTEVNAEYELDNSIKVSGSSRVNVEIACDRCLTKYTHPLTAEFNLIFSDTPPEQPEEENQNEDGIEISGDSVDVEYYAGDVIQLKNAIQEQIVMALPHRALCSGECKGLCQSCGGNLNEGQCNCEKESGHPAFSALKNLKIDK